MKKILSFILTAVLCLGMATNVYAANSPSGDNSKLSTPTGLTWDSNWNPQWQAVEEAKGHYDIEIYKDGEEFYTGSWSMGTYATGTIKINLSPEIMESGSYTFRVKAVADYDDTTLTDSDFSEWSEAKVYTKPAAQLGTTVGYWDVEKEGVFHFNGVDNAGAYKVWLYKVGEDGYDRQLSCSWGTPTTNTGSSADTLTRDFTNNILDEGKYYVKIQALSADIATIANGEVGAQSEIFDTAITSSAVSGAIDSALASGDVNTAVDTLKAEVPVSSMRTAMQTDAAVLQKVASLEASYAAQKGITVTNNVSEDAAKYVDSSKISMVGAALNADAGNVNLAITEPATKVDVPTNRYANSVQLDLKLFNGDTSKSELDFPITITMPVPVGVTLDRLTILHYHQDGTREVINPRVNADNTLTFTVTKFSTFVFANEVAGVEPDTQPETTVGGSGGGSQEIDFEAADGRAMRWISSKQNNDISISGTLANIPEGAVFNANKIVSGDAAILVKNAVANAKGDVEYVAYDFTLETSGGQPITNFNGHVDIGMPIPNVFTIDEGEVVSVYYVTEAGKLQRCNSAIGDDNFIVFGTSHLSPFVYVVESASSAASSPIVNGIDSASTAGSAVTSPKTAETNMAFYMTMLTIAALGVVVYGTRKVKYNR